MTVSATEYTTGPNGLAAMPADLPPATAYTYAVELSVGEGQGGFFDPPIPVYVDNFLEFSPGSALPSGYYDRALAQWVSTDNGVVIELLGVTADRAELDVDGSGLPADASSLAALGFTDGELEQLALAFAVGNSFWRVRVAHFSHYDFNLGYVPPSGAEPGEPGDDADRPPDEPCEQPGGSIIECETQVLRENVSIAGTPYQLAYRSDRVLAIVRGIASSEVSQ